MAWSEECSPDPVLAEQLEDAANSLRPELAARDHARRLRCECSDPYRVGVVVECQGNVDIFPSHRHVLSLRRRLYSLAEEPGAMSPSASGVLGENRATYSSGNDYSF
jgi:hypothetical protein